MDKNILKTVILDNQVEVPKYKVIPRDFVFEDFGNYVFVGIRRAGKTFLLYQRMQQLLAQGVHWDDMLYINFEDERLGGMAVDFGETLPPISVIPCHYFWFFTIKKT